MQGLYRSLQVFADGHLLMDGWMTGMVDGHLIRPVATFSPARRRELVASYQTPDAKPQTPGASPRLRQDQAAIIPLHELIGINEDKGRGVGHEGNPVGWVQSGRGLHDVV